MTEWLKRCWRDPVWGQVIAAGLIAVIAAALKALGGQLAGVFRRDAALIASGASVALLISAFASLVFRIRLHTELNVALDDFPHAPWIDIAVGNLSWRKVRIAAVQFLTKQHWDLPDPRRDGVTVPVARALPKNTPYIQISMEAGSVATRAVGLTLPPRGTARIQFRLITDHSPGFGFGLFPVHMGVSLIVGRKNAQIPLPDILVSLHGGHPVTESVSTRIIDPFYDPGAARSGANQALSVIEPGARSHDRIIAILRQEAAAETRPPIYR